MILAHIIRRCHIVRCGRSHAVAHVKEGGRDTDREQRMRGEGAGHAYHPHANSDALTRAHINTH